MARDICPSRDDAQAYLGTGPVRVVSDPPTLSTDTAVQPRRVGVGVRVSGVSRSERVFVSYPRIGRNPAYCGRGHAGVRFPAAVPGMRGGNGAAAEGVRAALSVA